MLEALANAFRLPDLRRRILVTAGILVVFRFVAHIPVPGVNLVMLRQLFESNSLWGMMDLFSGGAMYNYSVAAMGVYPYITASIIIQLLIPIIPKLEEMYKEGEAGRQKVNLIMHVMTVPLAALQAFGQSAVLANQGIITKFGFTPDAWLPTLSIVVSMTAGTIFCMWLGELITESGVGNGVSIIIFGGIVSRAPQGFGRSVAAGGDLLGYAFFLLIELATVAAIVIVTMGERRIPVQYAKRIRGNRMYGGQSTHVPLKVNAAGMIPLIFASSILLFPGIIASYFVYAENELVKNIATAIMGIFNTTGWFYWAAYFVMVIGFTYFYTATTFQQQNLPENLQKYGGFVPGIRPGAPTKFYLDKVLNRITLVGALFLGTVAILPYFTQLITGVETMALSSTGLLIVVGVVLDTMKQLEAQLLMRHYEGFIK
ncbi:MAG: preprotein translocase subunit SecY [Chloroflexota bacterium]|nr:preprotein translocase subunit SecY [Chloroflexota bacterium]